MSCILIYVTSAILFLSIWSLFLLLTSTFFSPPKNQIARKRHKVIGTFRSPPGHTRPPASLKHIHLMPLSQIKKVLDIRETEGMVIG